MKRKESPWLQPGEYVKIAEYSWWGFDDGNEPPDNLKTRKQLSEMGLRPGEPVGVIRTPKYDCYLYDPETCPPKRPLSEKQQVALQRRRQAKKQAQLERKRRESERDLLNYLDRIPFYLDNIIIEGEWSQIKDSLDFNWIRNRCVRIVKTCQYAKEELKFLYPLPELEPGSLVLGGRSRQEIPVDSDGQCRAVVLGGRRDR